MDWLELRNLFWTLIKILVQFSWYSLSLHDGKLIIKTDKVIGSFACFFWWKFFCEFFLYEFLNFSNKPFFLQNICNFVKNVLFEYFKCIVNLFFYTVKLFCNLFLPIWLVKSCNFSQCLNGLLIKIQLQVTKLFYFVGNYRLWKLK